MFETINVLIRETATWWWGFPLLALLSIVGVYFTFRLRGLQLAGHPPVFESQANAVADMRCEG